MTKRIGGKCKALVLIVAWNLLAAILNSGTDFEADEQMNILVVG